MHEKLWKQIEKLNPQKNAQRADCNYISDCECYVITFLSDSYIVDIKHRQIFFEEDLNKQPVTFLDQLCILAYLINAKDLPLSNKLVKAETFPGGQFFFRGPHQLPIQKIQDAFGHDAELLFHSAKKFNGKKREFGDCSIEIFPLPKISVVFVVWEGDDEFQPRASILFDQTASEHLPLDALWTMANLAAKKLIKNAEKKS